MEILKVEDLSVEFVTPFERVMAVKNVSFSLNQGEILALVGESGSGKTVTALAILRLLPSTAKILSGKIIFEGKDILKFSKEEVIKCKIRGRGIATIPQDPGNSLNPIMKVGNQIKEELDLSGSAQTVEELLRLVEIPDPKRVAEAYPHELSGGMKQRAIIAMALAGNPKIILADEPTTALDVTVQAKILDILVNLARKFNLGVLFISHNLGLVAEYADRVVVMKKGEVVERADVFTLFSRPSHQYTRSLIEVVPRLDGVRFRVEKHHPAKNILEVKALNVHFVQRNFLGMEKVRIRAVNNINFDIQEGESVGIVGESGCGKTTLARSIIRIVPRNSTDVLGTVNFYEKDVLKMSSKEVFRMRKDIQLIIQENVSALNPRKSVGGQIAEVFSIHNICEADEAEKRAEHLMDEVGISSTRFDRFPAEFSSGERQRLVIARVLSVRPKLLILDEPVASLDAPVQAQILDLLTRLKKEYGLTYLFISHDVSVVREMCHRILVMYLGKIVEIAESKELVSKPLHPYTQALISAVPIPDPVKARSRKRIYLAGEPPSPSAIVTGCRFHTRCPYCKPVCKEVGPELKEVGPGHLVACHLI